MRNVITDLKESLIDGMVKSFSWLSTKAMVADILTKECKDDGKLEEIMKENVFRFSQSEDNLVEYVDGEIQLKN